MLSTIANVYEPFFRHRCARCGQWTDSPQLMADEAPFWFVCQSHWTPDEYIRATREYAGQFRALAPARKHDIRVRLFGEARTREIEAGAPR